LSNFIVDIVDCCYNNWNGIQWIDFPNPYQITLMIKI